VQLAAQFTIFFPISSQYLSHGSISNIFLKVREVFNICAVATSGTVRNFRRLVSLIRMSHEADILLHPKWTNIFTPQSLSQPQSTYLIKLHHAVCTENPLLYQFTACNFAKTVTTTRGKLSYLAPLGSENISAPYFKQCFFRGGGYYPPDSQTPRLPVPRQK